MNSADLHAQLTSFLEPDGSLRDIVVKETTRADWLAILNELDARQIPCNYNGIAVPSNKIECLPDDFANRQNFGTLLIYPGSVFIKTDFFDEDEVEFDVNPKDLVSAPHHWDLLLNFMQLLSHATGKQCHLTHENRHDWIALTWDPTTKHFILGTHADGL